MINYTPNDGLYTNSREFFSGNPVSCRSYRSMVGHGLPDESIRSLADSSGPPISIDRFSDLYGIEDNDGKLIEKDNYYPKHRYGYYMEYFSEDRSMSVDFIAFYCPWHYYGEGYGIYINTLKFWLFIQYIVKQTGYSMEEAKNFGLEIILQHERFHYITEVYATDHEYKGNGSDIFKKYHSTFYENNYGSPDCIEESLANYFIYIVHNRLDKKKRDFLHVFFASQKDGYKQANDISVSNREDKFNKFEEQIAPFMAGKNRSSILHNTLGHPMLEFVLDGRLNIPIYLVNDFTDINDFYEIASIIFPRVELPFTSGDFKLSYNGYDSWLGEKTLEIDCNGNSEYYFENRMDGSEECARKLSRSELIKIINNINRSDFFSADYHEICPHPQELSIQYRNKTKKALFCMGSKLNELMSVIFDIVKAGKDYSR